MTLAQQGLALALELALLAIALLAIGAVILIVVVRNLQISYKEMYRAASKFDIELRKTANLLSKVPGGEAIQPYLDKVIKELPHTQKKALLQLVDDVYEAIDVTLEKHKYLVETYENLQENRRVLDAKVLLFNQKIAYFPFSFAARLMKIKKQNTYTHK
jgi:hypothetical protein